MSDFFKYGENNKEFNFESFKSKLNESVEKKSIKDKLFNLFDSNSDGKLQDSEIKTIFDNMVKVANADGNETLENTEFEMFFNSVSPDLKDEEKKEIVEELNSFLESEDAQELSYTTNDGKNITDKYDDNNNIIFRTIKQTDENNVNFERVILYQNNKPFSEIVNKNGEKYADITYLYNVDNIVSKTIEYKDEYNNDMRTVFLFENNKATRQINYQNENVVSDTTYQYDGDNIISESIENNDENNNKIQTVISYENNNVTKQTI